MILLTAQSFLEYCLLCLVFILLPYPDQWKKQVFMIRPGSNLNCDHYCQQVDTLFKHQASNSRDTEGRMARKAVHCYMAWSSAFQRALVGILGGTLPPSVAGCLASLTSGHPLLVASPIVPTEKWHTCSQMFSAGEELPGV